ncbi:ribonuclease H-like domain-containing protein [Mycena metata]|uniref:Ribonuclease H-like domain-containing protein n=1 Tax=Mycena metata TaxID=1033252 RepID=A0AAD7NAS2_9AGAR|nr:ribonuclease H-like domain-containing protein [Mycena metata]
MSSTLPCADEESVLGFREIPPSKESSDLLQKLGLQNFLYIVAEKAANEKLCDVRDGPVGFDTEFVKRIPSATEKMILKMRTPGIAAKKYAKHIIRFLESKSEHVYEPAWDNRGLCLIQLSVGDTAWVLNMKKIKAFPKELKRILTSPSITLTGAGLNSDADVVWEDLRIDMPSLADVGLMTRLADPESRTDENFQHLALDAAAEQILEVTIDKSRQKTVDWKGTLDDGDIIYAAIDAAVSIRLFQTLDTKLYQKSVLIDRKIPSSWYTYRMVEGEIVRIEESIKGTIIPWSTRDCTWYINGRFQGYFP